MPSEMKNTKQIPLSRAILCTVLCVIFTFLTTYQVCFYTLLSQYKSDLAYNNALFTAKIDALTVKNAELEQENATLAAALATKEAEVEALTARLLELTGKIDGTAEDCLRLLLTRALEKRAWQTGATPSAAIRAEVEAYMAASAADFTAMAERLLFVDYLYRRNYYGREDGLPTYEEMQEAAVEGYIAAAGDMYGKYYTPEEYDAFYDQMTASLCGIGASTLFEDGKMTVLYLHEQGPAKAAGLLVGDRIVKVNGQAYTDRESMTAALLGEAGDAVELTLEREGGTAVLSIKRASFTADAVIGEIKTVGDKRIGRLRLLAFNAQTATQLKARYEAMLNEGIDGIVFDVRDNTGGTVDAVTATLNYILPANLQILSYEYSNSALSKQPVFTADDADEITLPMVVLQNRNTASAAEIFAAVLHEYKNAPLVGETTSGKGVVQSGYRLGDGSYLAMTVCAYRAGTGEGYHGTGIAPTLAQAVAAGYETTSVYLLSAEQDLPLTRALSAAAGVQ